MKNKGVLYVLLAGILWGTMGVFVRNLNAYGLQALEITVLRVLTAFLVVGLYLLMFKRELLKIRLKDLWCFLGTGVVSLFFFSTCYFRSMNYVNLATAAILLYTAPVFVMLISIWLFREKLTKSKLLALVMAFAGCVLVSGIADVSSLQPKGLLLGIGSGFFYALYSIFSRYAINKGYQSWTIIFYTFLFCLVACLFAVDWTVIGTAVAAHQDIWLWALGLGIVTGFLPYLFYSKGLETLESSKASIFASMEPVVSAIFGVVVFHEVLTLMSVAGIALVLAAVIILSLTEKKAN